MTKEYLGDSVFAVVEVEGEVLVLTTENGVGIVSNRIYLEPEVRTKLIEYIDELGLEAEQPAPRGHR